MSDESLVEDDPAYWSYATNDPYDAPTHNVFLPRVENEACELNDVVDLRSPE